MADFVALKIPTPATFVTTEKNKTFRLIKKISYPFVLKDPYGYGGHQVFLVENKKEALALAEKIFSQSGLKSGCSTCKNIFYAQEYVRSERDLRVITIGGKTVAAYWRIGPQGSWKHNLDQGAIVSADNIPAAALAICEKFSRKMGFHWMGFDLLPDAKKQFTITEYSATVRVRGALETGVDVRKKQAEYIYHLLKSKK